MNWTSLPTLNFQFLSLMFTLTGNNAVEKKLWSPIHSSSDIWICTSCLWSTFGLFGAFSFYSKSAIGVATSASAGRPLAVTRAGVYSHFEKENSPSSSWSSTQAEELLSLIPNPHGSTIATSTSESTWLRPIFVVVGCSKCGPQDSAKWYGNGITFFWMLFSLCITIMPTMMLSPSLRNLELFEIVKYVQTATSLLIATILPMIRVYNFNKPLVEPLSKVYQDRLRAKSIPLLQEDDLIISDPRKECAYIVWQTASSILNRKPDSEARKGNIGWCRFLAGLNCLYILGTFLGTYTALGHATTERQYLWLGAQLIIFAFRFVMWSKKPPVSPPSFLYLATGSLSHTVSSIPLAERIHASHNEKLNITVMNFALAAAVIKARERGVGPIQPELYARMANNVPSDIISVEYVELGQYFNEKSKISILQLPWEVLEEIYRAQGVILGHKPREAGGIYLGVVFVEDTFVGLTTVHPLELHAQHCRDKSCAGRHNKFRLGGFTRDGYFLTDLNCGAVVGLPEDSGGVEGNIRDLHDLFRANVAWCRSTARSNGPSYVKIHITTQGSQKHLEDRHAGVVRVEPVIDDINESIRASAYSAMTNDRDDCRPDECKM